MMIAAFLGAAILAMSQSGTVTASLETDPVTSLEDAADDPAFWYNEANPAGSLILGTDKQQGLRVYDLAGREIAQSLVGELNNVDLVAGITLDDWSGDLAAATNRTDDSVVLFSVTAKGAEPVGGFSVAPEPYGFCMGRDGDALILFVAHKQGYVQPYRLFALGEPPVALPPIHFWTQIEGCVHDEATGQFYVGEETRGIWTLPFAQGRFDVAALNLIDWTGSDTGLAADVEGLTIHDGAGERLLVASSQGDDTFHVYRLGGSHAFLGKFSVTADPASGIDGAQETDGIAAVSVPLPGFPSGILIVQDGFNVTGGIEGDGRTGSDEPLAPQNFKIIDWQQIAARLEP